MKTQTIVLLGSAIYGVGAVLSFLHNRNLRIALLWPVGVPLAWWEQRQPVQPSTTTSDVMVDPFSIATPSLRNRVPFVDSVFASLTGSHVPVGHRR